MTHGEYDDATSALAHLYAQYETPAANAAARFAPTGSNLGDYGVALRTMFGYGVAACYRGAQLYSDAASQQLVAAHVAWYKRFRGLLTRDVIHVRRPDDQGLDAVLHADPTGGAARADGVLAVLVVFNPTDAPAAGAPLRVPLYYTGLEARAAVAQEPAAAGAVAAPLVLPLRRRDYSIVLPVTVGARAATWYTISKPAGGQI